MKVLVLGNMGYVGSILMPFLRTKYSDYELYGFDIGYFAHAITSDTPLPETALEQQYIGDVRKFPNGILNGMDAVVYLAAISNDPMGNEFEDITYEVNYKSAIRIAEAAKKAGVQTFTFASSCSVYGTEEDGLRDEASPLKPLTAYAKSKIYAEHDLENIAGNDFKITCLRFSTACGFSPRLRLDLVLNDFVASALATNKIEILSDGTPWRPLIHVQDMARAISWAIHRKATDEDYLSVNVGTEKWNFQIKDLGETVHQQLPVTTLTINTEAAPDNRSYKVDFTKFQKKAGEFASQVSIDDAIKDLIHGLQKMNFSDTDFRDSSLIRLNILRAFKEQNLLNNRLEWTR